jgi:hypothetical protein
MPQFIIDQEVTTQGPQVEVTITPTQPLSIGRHRFRLLVADDAGNQSRPDEVEVIVADQDAPTAVLTAPRIVGFGRSFNLSAENSFDVGGGRIVRYAWTYLGPPLIIEPRPPIEPTPRPEPIPSPGPRPPIA